MSKWKNKEEITTFENDNFQVIEGEYEGEEAIGVRWTDGVGFPSQGGHPTWLCLPQPFADIIRAIAENKKKMDNQK